MGKIAINGRFVVRRFGGQERYSYQVIQGLDDLAEKGQFELIVPNYAKDEKGKALRWNDPRTARARSKTFPGIARAMAEQWGGLED